MQEPAYSNEYSGLPWNALDNERLTVLSFVEMAADLKTWPLKFGNLSLPAVYYSFSPMYFIATLHIT